MKFGQKAALCTALSRTSIAGGALGASVIGSAGTQTSSTSSTASAEACGSTDSQSVMPAHGSAAHEDAEAAVTGEAATQAQAAAGQECR